MQVCRRFGESKTRIRRSRKKRGQSCDSIDDLEEQSAIESIPTLRGLSDFGSQIGGRFFSNVDLQNVILTKSSDGSEEEKEEENSTEKSLEKPTSNRLASDDTGSITPHLPVRIKTRRS